MLAGKVVEVQQKLQASHVVWLVSYNLSLMQQQRALHVKSVTLQEQLDVTEGLLVGLHVNKKQERHKTFFKRQLDRKQIVADQLRGELNATKQKLIYIERAIRNAERQLLVDQDDVMKERRPN